MHAHVHAYFFTIVLIYSVYGKLTLQEMLTFTEIKSYFSKPWQATNTHATTACTCTRYIVMYNDPVRIELTFCRNEDHMEELAGSTSSLKSFIKIEETASKENHNSLWHKFIKIIRKCTRTPRIMEHVLNKRWSVKSTWISLCKQPHIGRSVLWYERVCAHWEIRLSFRIHVKFMSFRSMSALCTSP